MTTIRVSLLCHRCGVRFDQVFNGEPQAEAARATPEQDRLCDACAAEVYDDGNRDEMEGSCLDEMEEEERCDCGDEFCDGSECEL